MAIVVGAEPVGQGAGQVATGSLGQFFYPGARYTLLVQCIQHGQRTRQGLGGALETAVGTGGIDQAAVQAEQQGGKGGGLWHGNVP
ncbi:hypothetical protein D3C81_1930110 [compost metagenome]